MCAAWKKKYERNEIVCFYCTQSGILCGIAKFSRGNKNKLRTFKPQKWKKIKNSQPQTKFTGSYKEKSVNSTKCRKWSWFLFYMCYSWWYFERGKATRHEESNPRDWYTNKNYDAISKLLCRLLTQENINFCLTKGTVPSDFQKAVFIQLIEMNAKLKNLTIDQLTFCRISQKYMKDSHMTKCILIYCIIIYLLFNVLYKHQCSFRKGYNAQNCLLIMIEKMKEACDKSKVCAPALS